MKTHLTYLPLIYWMILFHDCIYFEKVLRCRINLAMMAKLTLFSLIIWVILFQRAVWAKPLRCPPSQMATTYISYPCTTI